MDEFNLESFLNVDVDLGSRGANAFDATELKDFPNASAGVPSTIAPHLSQPLMPSSNYAFNNNGKRFLPDADRGGGGSESQVTTNGALLRNASHVVPLNKQSHSSDGSIFSPHYQQRQLYDLNSSPSKSHTNPLQRSSSLQSSSSGGMHHARSINDLLHSRNNQFLHQGLSASMPSNLNQPSVNVAHPNHQMQHQPSNSNRLLLQQQLYQQQVFQQQQYQQQNFQNNQLNLNPNNNRNSNLNFSNNLNLNTNNNFNNNLSHNPSFNPRMVSRVNSVNPQPSYPLASSAATITNPTSANSLHSSTFNGNQTPLMFPHTNSMSPSQAHSFHLQQRQLALQQQSQKLLNHQQQAAQDARFSPQSLNLLSSDAVMSTQSPAMMNSGGWKEATNDLSSPASSLPQTPSVAPAAQQAQVRSMLAARMQRLQNQLNRDKFNRVYTTWYTKDRLSLHSSTSPINSPQNVPIPPNSPRFASLPMDVYYFFIAVKALGGPQRLSEKNLWYFCLKCIGYPDVVLRSINGQIGVKGIAPILSEVYRKLLGGFDDYLRILLMGENGAMHERGASGAGGGVESSNYSSVGIDTSTRAGAADSPSTVDNSLAFIATDQAATLDEMESFLIHSPVTDDQEMSAESRGNSPLPPDPIRLSLSSNTSDSVPMTKLGIEETMKLGIEETLKSGIEETLKLGIEETIKSETETAIKSEIEEILRKDASMGENDSSPVSAYRPLVHTVNTFGGVNMDEINAAYFGTGAGKSIKLKLKVKDLGKVDVHRLTMSLKCRLGEEDFALETLLILSSDMDASWSSLLQVIHHVSLIGALLDLWNFYTKDLVKPIQSDDSEVSNDYVKFWSYGALFQLEQESNDVGGMRGEFCVTVNSTPSNSTPSNSTPSNSTPSNSAPSNSAPSNSTHALMIRYQKAAAKSLLIATILLNLTMDRRNAKALTGMRVFSSTFAIFLSLAPILLRLPFNRGSSSVAGDDCVAVSFLPHRKLGLMLLENVGDVFVLSGSGLATFVIKMLADFIGYCGGGLPGSGIGSNTPQNASVNSPVSFYALHALNAVCRLTTVLENLRILDEVTGELAPLVSSLFALLPAGAAYRTLTTTTTTTSTHQQSSQKWHDIVAVEMSAFSLLNLASASSKVRFVMASSPGGLQLLTNLTAAHSWANTLLFCSDEDFIPSEPEPFASNNRLPQRHPRNPPIPHSHEPEGHFRALDPRFATDRERMQQVFVSMTKKSALTLLRVCCDSSCSQVVRSALTLCPWPLYGRDAGGGPGGHFSTAEIALFNMTLNPKVPRDIHQILTQILLALNS